MGLERIDAYVAKFAEGYVSLSEDERWHEVMRILESSAKPCAKLIAIGALAMSRS